MNELVRVGGLAPSAFPGDSILFLKASGKTLPNAMAVMRAWGYEYQNTVCTWIKFRPDYEQRFHAVAAQDTHGIAVDNSEVSKTIEQLFLGRHNAEYILYGKRGTQPLYLMNHYAHEIILAPANKDIMPEVRKRIENLFMRPQDVMYWLNIDLEASLKHRISQAQIPEPVEKEQRIPKYEQRKIVF